MGVDFIKLSKIISHALRHEPWKYGFELDDEGWVAISELLDSLRHLDPEWHDLSHADIEQMIDNSQKQRHEIENDAIRCIYGHSLEGRLSRTSAIPPRILFHGTAPSKVELILRNGILPMKRQYVHLSADKETALEVGRRRSANPTILKVNALEAHECGVKFFKGNSQVWMSDSVPAQFLLIEK